MKIVILGLSIASSWGNGHATTFRSLVRNLGALGHEVLFVERDVNGYRDNRDDPCPPGCRVGLHRSLTELKNRWWGAVAGADAAIVGSYVPEGVGALEGGVVQVVEPLRDAEPVPRPSPWSR